jgi:hypothetical protein
MKHKRQIAFAFSASCVVFLFCCEALGQSEAPPPAVEDAAHVAPVVPPQVDSTTAPVEIAPPIESEPAPAVEPALAPVPKPGAAEARPAAEKGAAEGGDSAAEDEGSEDGKDSPKKKKKVEINGRVHLGYDVTRAADSPTDGGRKTENAFDVRRASAQLTWRPEKWLKAVVQIDVAEAFELGTSILTDAYVHLTPVEALQIRLGQFKKPFSALVLQSPSKLRVIDRGPGVEFIAKDLLYGDRDLGLQLSGLLVKKLKLEYSVGAFNGNGPNITEKGNSKDVAARIQMRPIKQLEIGVNGSAKFFSDPSDRQPSRAFAGGGDLRIGLKGFRFYAEALVAQDHEAYTVDADATADDVPISFVALGIATYRHKFDTKSLRFAVEPAFKVELFDQNAEVADDQLWVFTPGINGYFGDYFKLMLNGAFTRSGRNARSEFPDAEAIEVLACFDI